MPVARTKLCVYIRFRPLDSVLRHDLPVDVDLLVVLCAMSLAEKYGWYIYYIYFERFVGIWQLSFRAAGPCMLLGCNV